MNIKSILFSLLLIGTSATPSITIAGNLSDKEIIYYMAAMSTGAVVGGAAGTIGGGTIGFLGAIKCAREHPSQSKVILLCGTAIGAAIGATGGLFAGIELGQNFVEVVLWDIESKQILVQE